MNALKPTTLAIFDFDGTLYQSAINPSAKPTFHLNAASLHGYGPPGFDPRWDLGVVQAARRAVEDPFSRTMLLTSRPRHKQMVEQVSEMLRSADLAFDALYFKPLLPVVREHVYKAGVVKRELVKHPSVLTVVFFEDEPENMEAVGRVAVGLRRAFTPVIGRGLLPA